MKAHATIESNKVSISIRPNLFDRCKRLFRRLKKQSHLENFEFYFRYSFEVDDERINPDFLTLAILLSLYPYLGFPWLSVNAPVSMRFRQLCRRHLGIFVSAPSPKGKGGDYEKQNVEDLDERPTVKKSLRPGLAFSMGTDSLAARMMMPEDTYSLFIDRPTPASSLYKKENLLDGLRGFVKNIGEADVVFSNFENLRKPIGFAVIDSKPDLNLAALAPLVTVANVKRLDSLSLGTVSESLYGFGGMSYSDPSDSQYFAGFANLLADVGLPLFLPLGGLSEVNSIRISINNTGVTAWSCIRGTKGKPCLNCYKCFRKESLKADLLSKSYSNDVLNALMDTPEVSRNLTSPYIHHGGVLAWQVKKFPKRAYAQLDNSLVPYQTQFRFIEKWFIKAAEYVPQQHKLGFAKKLEKFGILPTTDEECTVAMNWNAESAGKGHSAT